MDTEEGLWQVKRSSQKALPFAAQEHWTEGGVAVGLQPCVV